MVANTGASAHRPARALGAQQLDAAARVLAPHGAPAVVFSASHSGSRLLAQMLARLGFFMGAHLNDSEDSLDVFELTRYVVGTHGPDFGRLFADGDPRLEAKVDEAFRRHLDGRPDGARWGWKLPETAHALPVMARLFPQARCIHLVRDGRDVAFSPFVAPKDPFWRKIHFNTDQIRSWRGLRMTQRAYRRSGHVFNAIRWANSVTLGRAHGQMLGDRYLEVSYEALVADPAAELTRISAFLQAPGPSFDLEDLGVRSGSVGKWRDQPRKALREIRPILEPALAAFGYRWEGARLWSWGSGVSAGPRAEPGGLGGLFRVRARR